MGFIGSLFVGFSGVGGRLPRVGCTGGIGAFTGFDGSTAPYGLRLFYASWDEVVWLCRSCFLPCVDCEVIQRFPFSPFFELLILWKARTGKRFLQSRKFALFQIKAEIVDVVVVQRPGTDFIPMIFGGQTDRVEVLG
ncbi:hypothetical protein MTX20_08880 [Bradyrhizobium sp. ISRA435]|nr:hypothetical protein MTX20_08880 [Bradyrhizobium sp. ISRA435]